MSAMRTRLPVVACVLLSVVYLTSTAFGKVSWQRTYGGDDDDQGRSVQQTSDGGFIVCGSTTRSTGYSDTYLIRTNAQGDTLWTRTCGGTKNDEGYSVQQTADGGYIVAGTTRSFGAGGSDVYLIRTDASGDTLWTRTYGGTNDDQGNCVQPTSDGGYIVAGWTYSFGASGHDVYLIKADADGDTLWTKTYGGFEWDEGFSVEQTADGGYVIGGYTSGFGAGAYDVYVIKTNASGDTLWTRTYGGAELDYGYSIQQTSDGGYVIAGASTSFSGGPYDVYLVKTNASGDTLWTRTYGPSEDGGYSVQQTADGGYIVAGFTYSHSRWDVYLIKTDPKGDTLWTRTYGGSDYDAGYSVQQTTDGGYVVAGYTRSFGTGNTDVYLIRTDANVDVGPVATLSPSLIAESGLVYLPSAIVRGYNVASAAFPVTMRIGANYTRTVQETLAAPLDTVVFPPWTAGPVGSVMVTCYTSLTGDENPDNDTIRDSVRVLPSPLDDVGPIAVLSPAAAIESGSVCVPRAVVRNFGQFPAVFPISMTIGSDYNQTVSETLGPGTIDTVAFPSWVAGPVGSLVVTCFTSLAGDENPNNDTISDSVRVVPWPMDDVGAVAILSPPGNGESGRVYLPRAVVRNSGSTPEVFPVTMHIGAGYSRTVQETLASGLSDTVTFPPWTAGPVGTVAVICFTSLFGDEDPANDSISDSIRVVPAHWYDVGAVAIVSPSGVVRAGDTIMPRARVRNFGNVAERFFDTRFSIGASYSHTVNVAEALLPDSTAELAFPPWVADSGNWTVSCSTMLANDMDSANDKVSSSVQVFAQSLGIDPDQADRLEAGKTKTYRFYALIQGDTGAVVEVAWPSPPPGWCAKLCDATGANDLTDTDGDGIPDLGYVAPGKSGWFSLDVTAPSTLAGETTSIKQATFLVAGYAGDYPLAADTALLILTLLPAFSVHNYPNPFSDRTAFVIGLPEDGKASLTVYTRAGERVCRILENADLPAGVHVLPWAGVNDNGRSIAPGTYEYLLDYVHTGKTERIRKKLVLTRQ
jgi:hypothetical protein